jgi:hypothetical protein
MPLLAALEQIVTLQNFCPLLQRPPSPAFNPSWYPNKTGSQIASRLAEKKLLQNFNWCGNYNNEKKSTRF